MFGLLNVNKPQGVTSRDVVNRVQRLVRPAKVGHAGTLDPLATGVLILALGPATRLIEYVQRAPKRYRAEFLLGRESDTEDVEGRVVELSDPPQPTREEIAKVLPRFLGRIEQRPPAYSALKVAGKRAYNLARAGKPVELPPREVEVHSLEIVAYRYPRLTLKAVCGSGTYLRSLGRDIAQAVGTAAVMSALVRTAVGPFLIDQACDLERLSADSIPRLLRPPVEALADLPRVTLEQPALERVARGMIVDLDVAASTGELAALDEEGRLRAILVRRGQAWGPSRNFPA